jgi:hypothetical protein
MLRVLISLGALLMLFGFGAAGWQYWQSLPANAAATTEVADLPEAKPQQNWLISPTGGLVPQATVRTYLVQDRFVRGRTALVTRTARLSDLLGEGEKLPEQAYLQVLADIRAPKVGEALCAALTASIALDCAVNSARVVEGSVDPAAGTANFTIEMVFREKLDGADLPDLAEHVLRQQSVSLALDPAEEAGQACRITMIAADWAPGRPVPLRAEIAWLAPLPEGVFSAPPLDAAPEG